MLTVGIFIFNEVEVLDFAGPFEVFSLARNVKGEKLFHVVTIAERSEVIVARNGLKLLPMAVFDDNIAFDILIIAGGYGAEEIEIKNKAVLHWIKAQKEKVKVLASVCTGAFLLAECGLLNNRKATTHWLDVDKLSNDYPLIEVKRNIKYIDEEDIITSGGISAGINMSFYLIKKLYGIEVAKETAKRMEYEIEI